MAGRHAERAKNIILTLRGGTTGAGALSETRT